MSHQRVRGLNIMTDNPESEPIQIILSENDWQFIIEALDAPPVPNEALKELMREFGPWKDGGTFQIEE